MNSPKSTLLSLLSYCRQSGWAGYDPYDALNSRIVDSLPFLNSRISRLALTQILKRSPVNLRPLLLVPKTQNPKGIALFLTAFVKLSKLGLLVEMDLIDAMLERLTALRSEGTPYWCWGYNFPWQTRTILVPRGEPNLVCTAFAANALLDVFEARGDPTCLNMAANAAEYIFANLLWSGERVAAAFRYPTISSPAPVHNANFLGAALLCRVFKHSGEQRYLDAALKVTRYSVSRQRDDGSWPYGELQTQSWVDNFHTGYNLCALQTISEYAATSEFDDTIGRGFTFYRGHFFREDGAPRYFSDRTYPIDIHSVAQSIITLLALRHLDQGSADTAGAVYRWAMAHMWNRDGYFYFQTHPLYTIRTPYMRWSQAWMLLALSVMSESSVAQLG